MLDVPTRCTTGAYAYLAKRWYGRTPGPRLTEPDNGLSEWGSSSRQAALAQTLGANVFELELVGRGLRVAREEQRTAKSRKRRHELALAEDRFSDSDDSL